MRGVATGSVSRRHAMKLSRYVAMVGVLGVAIAAAYLFSLHSKGNVYTTETYEGKRIQKFVYKGLGPMTKANQGFSGRRLQAGRSWTGRCD
jgi:hypothetical protein